MKKQKNKKIERTKQINIKLTEAEFDLINEVAAKSSRGNKTALILNAIQDIKEKYYK